jgi:uncharacterized membrane protein
MNNPADPNTASKDKVRQVEIAISNVLRIGVISSLVIVVIGTVLTFAHHPEYASSSSVLPQLTSHNAVFPHTLTQTLDATVRGQGRGIVMVGLLLLVATPVLRVAISILGFVYERDWVFVVITCIVLGLLLLSFVLGRAEG